MTQTAEIAPRGPLTGTPEIYEAVRADLARSEPGPLPLLNVLFHIDRVFPGTELDGYTQKEIGFAARALADPGVSKDLIGVAFSLAKLTPVESDADETLDIAMPPNPVTGDATVRFVRRGDFVSVSYAGRIAAYVMADEYRRAAIRWPALFAMAMIEQDAG